MAQRVLLEAAVRFVVVITAKPILLRLAAFFLLHAAKSPRRNVDQLVSRMEIRGVLRWFGNRQTPSQEGPAHGYRTPTQPNFATSSSSPRS